MDLYLALEVIMKTLALKRRATEEKLLRQFARVSKSNGGQNISLDDFNDIFEFSGYTIKPRQVTRMYRDAVCYKKAGSCTVWQEAFLYVCGKYNIVPHITVEELQKAFSDYDF